MAECDLCGINIDSPFTCNYCGGTFCGKHRLPPNHDCPNIASWKSRSGPSLGTHEKKKSWLAGGEVTDQKPSFGSKRTSWWAKKKIAIIIILILLIAALYWII